jgi:hypothetical protein
MTTRQAGGFVCPAKRETKGHVSGLGFPRYPGAQHRVLGNAINSFHDFSKTEADH